MNPISSENTSFSYLRGSPDFLGAVLDSISSCLLLLDKDMKLQAFNDPLRSIFSNRKNEHMLYRFCGNAIGCAFAIEEEKDCGITSNCCNCELRKCALSTYSEGISYHNNLIERDFYRVDGSKQKKILRFSTRLIRYSEDRYVLVIVDDVTELIENRRKISRQEALLRELEKDTVPTD
jgi:nitrogen fixation/metabolism regulation signal transduction histidine kinase